MRRQSKRDSVVIECGVNIQSDIVFDMFKNFNETIDSSLGSSEYLGSRLFPSGISAVPFTCHGS